MQRLAESGSVSSGDSMIAVCPFLPALILDFLEGLISSSLAFLFSLLPLFAYDFRRSGTGETP